MNVITILIDSLNKHYLGVYGNENIHTPNLDYLAKQSIVFNNHFISSAPCMPARRELFTGRREFFWRGWGHMEPFDRHLAVEASSNGAVTQMITDHYHYWENNANGYMECFDGLEMIRGNELDFWKTDYLNEELPEWVKKASSYRDKDKVIQFYRNVKNFNSEEDFFIPKVMKEAESWLDRNYKHENFYLHIEAFGCHEPFYVPEPYRSMYTDENVNSYNIWPPYQSGHHGHENNFWNDTSPAELEYIRSQYMGRVTMVDKWIGGIFKAMDRHNLWENTMLIFTTDHGHELGEKERFGKQYPHYDLNANIPLIIYHPEYANNGGKVDSFTQTIDLYPTILEVLGVDSINSPNGRSIIPLMTGEKSSIRSNVVYGTFGTGAVITDNEFTFATEYNNEANELNWYSTQLQIPDAINIEAGKWMLDINLPLWKMTLNSVDKEPAYLFDRQLDPKQDKNIVDEKSGIVRKMKDNLKDIMEEEGVPQEQFARLGLE